MGSANEEGCLGWTAHVPHGDSRDKEHESFMHFATFASKEDHDRHLERSDLGERFDLCASFPRICYYDRAIQPVSPDEDSHLIGREVCQTTEDHVSVMSRFVYMNVVNVNVLKIILQLLADEARQSPGCIGFDAGLSVDDETQEVMVMQVWKRPQDYQAFRKTRICSSFEKTSAFTEGPAFVSLWRSFRFYDGKVKKSSSSSNATSASTE